jgi:hypothetical protein
MRGKLKHGLWFAVLLQLPAEAADVGGWYAEQLKAAAAKPDDNACPQVLKRAASAGGTGFDAYGAALCYLQAEPPDALAAKAWLTRSAELNYLPAHRMLQSLQRAESGPHSAAAHCHDIGQGRQICHGGAPVAAATKN